jgi:hypothetical protein
VPIRKVAVVISRPQTKLTARLAKSRKFETERERERNVYIIYYTYSWFCCITNYIILYIYKIGEIREMGENDRNQRERE